MKQISLAKRESPLSQKGLSNKRNKKVVLKIWVPCEYLKKGIQLKQSSRGLLWKHFLKYFAKFTRKQL